MEQNDPEMMIQQQLLAEMPKMQRRNQTMMMMTRRWKLMKTMKSHRHIR
jgi:hypothetical protein